MTPEERKRLIRQISPMVQIMSLVLITPIIWPLGRGSSPKGIKLCHPGRRDSILIDEARLLIIS